MGISKNYQKALDISAEHGEFQILGYIKGKSPKLKLKCNNCGEEFERYQSHFIQYPHICPKCAPKGRRQYISLEEAQLRINQVYGDKYLVLLDYKGNNVKVNVKCDHCGLVFQSVPSNLWRGRVKGCPNCEKIKSLGEAKLERFFRENNVQYRAQERFIDCKDKMMLPFDFYLPQHNTCVEFQGEQHYNKTSLLWSETLILHDNIKKEYCNKKNIGLVIIPFYDINEIEKYFKFIQE